MKLFEPGRIGKLSLKNRIVMAPMSIGGLGEPDGRLSQRAIDYYVTRAKGGTGLIITGASRVHRWLEQPSNIPLLRHIMADSRLYISRFNELAEAIHDYGAKVAVQLTAGLGRVAGPEYLKDGDIAAPSALSCYWDPSVMTREMTIVEIERLVKDFEIGAEILSTAGIDAIELHGHEGYLFDQFLTPLWNRRTDKYGLTLDGRLRFPIEVIEAIKRGAGTDFPVIYRFGLTHYLSGGREVEEGLEIARHLENAGVDAFDVDAGCYETWYWAHPPTTQQAGCMVDMAEKVKKVVNIPIMAVGKLGYPELAERILQGGKADFIILGRSLLADPDWPNKVKEGRLEDICPCIGDHECLKRVLQRKYISCSVNPVAGMEREFIIKSAERKKSVLVVGGGPAGMEAARVSALRGHEVTLWEKTEALGGNFRPGLVPDFKKDYERLIKYLSTQIKKLGVTVEFNKEATPELIQAIKPDVIFIATGSTPIIPKIPGIEKKIVMTPVDVFSGKREAGESVAVIGGGLIGCETALHLAQKGKKVIIIELLNNVATDIYSANRMHLLNLLAEAKVDILTNRNVIEITNEGITLANTHGESKKASIDTVVFAVGLKSNRSLLEALKKTAFEIYMIGDSAEPGKIIDAIWRGFRTARLI